MSTYRPSPLAALLNGLGGSLPDFTNALVKRKWAGQDAEAAMAEKRREEESRAAMAAMGDRRDMSRMALLNSAATPGEAIGTDTYLSEYGYDVNKALEPTQHPAPFSPDVIERATTAAETLGRGPKPKQFAPPRPSGGGAGPAKNFGSDLSRALAARKSSGGKGATWKKVTDQDVVAISTLMKSYGWDITPEIAGRIRAGLSREVGTAPTAPAKSIKTGAASNPWGM